MMIVFSDRRFDINLTPEMTPMQAVETSNTNHRVPRATEFNQCVFEISRLKRFSNHAFVIPQSLDVWPTHK